MDGSLITADGSLVHARLSAGYRIADADRFVENIPSEEEQDLVRLLVEQATVRVIASVSVDELLTRAATFAAPRTDGEAPEADAPARSAASIERRITRAAQDALDRLESGIQVTEVSLTTVFPPLRVYREFQAVNRVDSEAARAREEAEEQRRRELNQVAGSAYRPLLDLMDEYENLMDLGRADEAERVLETVFAIFRGERDGRRVEIGGRTYDEVVFSGRAAEEISRARRTSQVIVDQAKRDAALYRAKLAQYRANPVVFVAREWSEALRSFMASPNVQQFHAPPDSDFTLQINNDPDIARELQRERQRRGLEQYFQERPDAR